MTAGALAGACAQATIYPFELVRSAAGWANAACWEAALMVWMLRGSVLNTACCLVPSRRLLCCLCILVLIPPLVLPHRCEHDWPCAPPIRTLVS